MPNGELRFEHHVIDPAPPGAWHDILLLVDLTASGLPDVVVGCKSGPPNVFWYENPGFERHEAAAADNLEAGGVMLDITGNGRPDLVAGQQASGPYLLWFEVPDDPRQPWQPRVIEDRFNKYHDQAVGDVDGDGQAEIVALSQQAGVLVYYDIPPNPRAEPWPREFSHIIAGGLYDVEGLAVVDIDGDGRQEIVAGTSIFYPPNAPGQPWWREDYAHGFNKTRVAVGDLTGDGRPDIVVSEGEQHPGRLVWFEAPDFKPHPLRDDLFHPHSLALADFDGDGRLDIFVAEMGLGRNPNPRWFVYLNRGGGQFEEVLIAEGIPTHEAKPADMTGDGLPDIVGKPYTAHGWVDILYNRSGR